MTHIIPEMTAYDRKKITDALSLISFHFVTETEQLTTGQTHRHLNNGQSLSVRTHTKEQPKYTPSLALTD